MPATSNHPLPSSLAESPTSVGMPDASGMPERHAANAAPPCYRILIHHDGVQFIAEVPELSGCRGAGDSYLEALQSAEQAIAAWLRCARSTGGAPPLLNPTSLTRKFRNCLCETAAGGQGRRRVSPVKQMLVDKFGKMSNRELAGRIGLIERDAPLILSAAASGQGVRKARCAIAVALGILPSQLWPDRAAALCQDDDAAYLAQTAGKPGKPVRRK